MPSERQYDRPNSIDHQSTESDVATAPWADLRLQVPNDRSDESIMAFVECVLVELTHEEVGAEYRSSNVFGATIDQYIAADATGQQFRERRYDERLGWFENQINRSDVRDNWSRGSRGRHHWHGIAVILTRSPNQIRSR
jgi:hypothetical protein